MNNILRVKILQVFNISNIFYSLLYSEKRPSAEVVLYALFINTFAGLFILKINLLNFYILLPFTILKLFLLKFIKLFRIFWIIDKLPYFTFNVFIILIIYNNFNICIIWNKIHKYGKFKKNINIHSINFLKIITKVFCEIISS